MANLLQLLLLACYNRCSSPIVVGLLAFIVFALLFIFPDFYVALWLSPRQTSNVHANDNGNYKQRCVYAIVVVAVGADRPTMYIHQAALYPCAFLTRCRPTQPINGRRLTTLSILSCSTLLRTLTSWVFLFAPAAATHRGYVCAATHPTVAWAIFCPRSFFWNFLSSNIFSFRFLTFILFYFLFLLCTWCCCNIMHATHTYLYSYAYACIMRWSVSIYIIHIIILFFVAVELGKCNFPKCTACSVDNYDCLGEWMDRWAHELRWVHMVHTNYIYVYPLRDVVREISYPRLF